MANIVKFVPIKRREFVEALKKGNSLSGACQSIGVSHDTVQNYRKKHRRFNELTLSLLKTQTVIVQDALYKNCLAGNVTAQIFWLVNRTRQAPPDEKWENLNKHEILGAGGGPVKIQVVYDDENGKSGIQGETPPPA